MKVALRKAGSREIGGILMGRQLSPGSFEIADFSLDTVSGARAHFIRDIHHHIDALNDFFERTGHDYSVFNYLGEWHSHPSFTLKPSPTDIESMRALVTSEMDIDFSVLMIVKIDFLHRFKATATLHTSEGVVENVDLLLS